MPATQQCIICIMVILTGLVQESDMERPLGGKCQLWLRQRRRLQSLRFAVEADKQTESATRHRTELRLCHLQSIWPWEELQNLVAATAPSDAGLSQAFASQAEMVLLYSDFLCQLQHRSFDQGLGGLMAFIPCQTHYTSLTKTATAEHVAQFRPPHLFGHLQKLGYSLCKTITIHYWHI